MEKIRQIPHLVWRQFSDVLMMEGCTSTATAAAAAAVIAGRRGPLLGGEM